jgi:hypothetical protein
MRDIDNHRGVLVVQTGVLVRQPAVTAGRSSPRRGQVEGAAGDQVEGGTQVGDALGSAGQAAEPEPAEELRVDEDAVDAVPASRGSAEPGGKVVVAGHRIGTEPRPDDGDGLAHFGLADDVRFVRPNRGGIALAGHAARSGRQVGDDLGVELPPRVAVGQRALGAHLDGPQQCQLRPRAGRVGPVSQVGIQLRVCILDLTAYAVVGSRGHCPQVLLGGRSPLEIGLCGQRQH